MFHFKSLENTYERAKLFSEPFQTSKMEFFAKIVKGSKSVTDFAKSSI